MKKYELTTETTTVYGRTLYRIKALRDFEDVKAGDLGGFIEKEANLSHKDTGWIYDNAKVSDNAKVFGNAKVYDNAKVWNNAKAFGNAEVYDDAEVYGDARVSGNAKVYGNAYVYGNAEVSDTAQVYDNAEVSDTAKAYGSVQVSDTAKVYGSAQVSGNAWVFGSADLRDGADIKSSDDYVFFGNVGSENGTLTCYKTADGINATRGCFTGTLDEFVAASLTHHANDAKHIHEEYMLLIAHAKLRLNRPV